MGRLSVEDRFWAKVEPTGFCWYWKDRPTVKGYGQFRLGDKKRAAHRLAYEFLVGPIPPGLVIDHLCRNRICVNPDHLEPVTAAENNARGIHWLQGSYGRRKTHCPQGHEYNEANTHVANNGWRRCRVCDRENKLALRKANNGQG